MVPLNSINSKRTAAGATLCAVLALALAAALAVALAPAPLHAATLDDAHRLQAIELASHVPWPSSATRSLPPTATPQMAAPKHPLGIQTLSVEAVEQKGRDNTDLALVYQFDHTRGRARRLMLDLASATVREERPITSVHLPLNDEEREQALALIADDAALIDALQAEQLRTGRPVFKDVTELDAKASIFEPDDPAHRCARERCALFSLFDASRTVLTIEPVVYFTDLTVGRLH